MVDRDAGVFARFGLGLVAVLTVASLAPLIGLFAAIALASGLGCTLDEGSAHPCVVAGTDIGDVLHTAFEAGWLVFLTGPLMIVTAAFWIVYGLRALIRRHERRTS